MNNVFLALLFIILTLVIYLAARRLYKLVPQPFMLPLLTGTITLIFILFLFNISYETYMIGGRWLEFLLGPAVVALAYPLYNQRKMLKKYFAPIVIAVIVGAIVGVVSGIQFAKWVGIEQVLIYSLLPKSVTTPVAMDIASTLGGYPPLAAVFVMIAGVGGIVLSPYLYRLFKITHSVSRGVGIGSASHAIGTSRLLEQNEKEGAASSIGMTLSAIFVSFFGPFFAFLLL